MAKVKAKVSFAGVVTMATGEIKEIADKAILDDLVSAGYVEEIKATPTKETAKKKGEK